MAFRIAGKRAFVTGGTDGIGRAVAERLLALGARVVVASNAAHGRQVLSELQARFGDRAAGFVMLDVCSRSELREGFAEGIRVLGGVDMVVANAGFASDIMSFHPARGTPLGPADLDREDDARWVRDIDGNLVGFGLLVRLATAYWWKNDMPGALVATASFAAIFGAGKVFGKSHFSFSYPATKAGQIAITNNMQLFVDGAAGEWCSPVSMLPQATHRRRSSGVPCSAPGWRASAAGCRWRSWWTLTCASSRTSTSAGRLLRSSAPAAKWSRTSRTLPWMSTFRSCRAAMTRVRIGSSRLRVDLLPSQIPTRSPIHHHGTCRRRIQST